MSSKSATRLRVCRASELQPGEARQVEIAGRAPIAIFNLDTQFYATDDTCTHADFSLAQGYIEGEEVECALHLARFNIKTGAVVEVPATKPLRVYPVEIEGEEVFVVVDLEEEELNREYRSSDDKP